MLLVVRPGLVVALMLVGLIIGPCVLVEGYAGSVSLGEASDADRIVGPQQVEWLLREADGVTAAETPPGNCTGVVQPPVRWLPQGGLQLSGETLGVAIDSACGRLEGLGPTVPFSSCLWLQTNAVGRMQLIGSLASALYEHAGVLLSTEDGVLELLVVHRLFRQQMLLARTSDRHLNDGLWHHVCATYDGTGFDDAVKLFIDGQQEHATIEQQSLPKVYAVTTEPHAAHHAWIGSAGPHAPASLGKPFSGRLQHPFMTRAVISAGHVHRLAVLAGGKLAPAQLTRSWLQLPRAQPYPHCVVQCRQMGRCHGVLFRGTKCRIAVSGRWSPRTAPWMRTRMNPRGWGVA